MTGLKELYLVEPADVATGGDWIDDGIGDADLRGTS